MADYIGVDVGGTRTKAGIVEFYKSKNKFQIIRENEILTEANAGFNTSMKNILKAIESILPENKKNKKTIKGIGIGFAGLVDAKKGIVNFANNLPGWKNVELKKIIEKRFGIKCFVDNDAKCAVLGEFLFGAGRGRKNIVLITLGTGLGCGVILNGKIYYGKTGEAGEIQAIPMLPEGKKLEHWVNANAIVELSGERPSKLAYKAEKGDSAALQVFRAYGERVGVVLSVVANTFEPEMIIMSGGISQSLDLFEKPALRVLKESMYEKSFRNLSIVKAQLAKPGVVGAAALFIRKQ